MYEYVKGLVTEIAPTYVVIETGGVGYIINISLQTYSSIGNLKELRLWVHHVIREDSELMFGFFEKEEREIFRLLTGIPGIGPNTARMILSSLSSSELRTAIMQNDILRLQNIKGIGSKTAQRLVVELKDKIIKISGTPDIPGTGIKTSVHEEALSALLMLGFAKAPAEKVIINLLRENNQYLLEDLIKAALKQL
jgi:Holliday junction DNA helicase RuvA